MRTKLGLYKEPMKCIKRFAWLPKNIEINSTEVVRVWLEFYYVNKTMLYDGVNEKGPMSASKVIKGTLHDG